MGLVCEKSLSTECANNYPKQNGCIGKRLVEHGMTGIHFFLKINRSLAILRLDCTSC